MNYYAHSISKFDKFDFNDIIILQKILSTGYVLSRRNLDLCEEDALFNGMDYISLCDLSAHHEYYSAYNIYVKNGLSLLFDKNIKVIKPMYINLDKRDLNIGEKMHELGLKGRYTNLSDEVEVKDKLSLEYLKGLLLSLEKIKKCNGYEYTSNYLNNVLFLLKKYSYDVPIINLDNEKVIKKNKYE